VGGPASPTATALRIFSVREKKMKLSQKKYEAAFSPHNNEEKVDPLTLSISEEKKKKKPKHLLAFPHLSLGGRCRKISYRPWSSGIASAGSDSCQRKGIGGGGGRYLSGGVRKKKVSRKRGSREKGAYRTRQSARKAGGGGASSRWHRIQDGQAMIL